MSANNLDIVNNKKWDNTMWLTFFNERLSKMRGARKEAEGEWEKIDNSYTLVSSYNNFWEIEVVIPLDKVLIEIYEGRTKGLINYDIKADWQTNIAQLQPAKYTLQFFLDWNNDWNFWEENKAMKSMKAKYWNWIFFTGLRNQREYMYKIKEDTEIQGWTDLLNENNFQEYIKEDWFFYPKNIDIRDFYIDDNAINQPSIQYADDCIFKEQITMSELELRFWHLDWIDKKELKAVSYWTDQDKIKDKQQENLIVIHYYYNKVTKDFLIVANETQLLLKTKYLYADWKLPFVNIQHYYNPKKFYAEWISWRVAYLKASKSDLFQNILSTASMWAWINLVVWNDDQVTEDWEIWGNKVNFWRTTWGAENVQQINSTPNLWVFTTILALIDQETAIVTWINPSEQITATSDVLWIVEINEANKAVRTGSVDESYELWLDNSLTMILSRIKQFAPHLLSEKIKDKEWNLLKTIFPKIKIPDTKVVKRKGGELSFEEDMGQFWYFELKPDVVEWVWVKITTNSTSSVLPIIERRKVQDYIKMNLELFQSAQLDPSGEAMKKLTESINFEQLIEWANDAYWIDQTALKANTKQDKIRHTNIEKLKLLTDKLKLDEPNQENTEIPEQEQNNQGLWGGEQGTEAIQGQPWNAINDWTSQL